ncbi:hypothetical protein CHU95_05320 [Niveispirillum lacus]|uniref:Uncharacterized protein n=1 Tax=Niveispirillum lacus TaxID=1981099 RepID=A0A255Z459_9PROT|nr:DUF6623 family protein [Niveispirillum lacus]OYQ36211.1 hypothetical protein CHU95_05320 [Niveispirillum lacus]
MVDTKQETQFTIGNRRSFFGAALSVGAGLGLGTGLARAGSQQNPISWVHGTSATVADAQGLERDRVEGNARIVNGRSWSDVQLHFAVPAPVLDTGAALPVAAVWVRFRAQKGARIQSLTVHDCERTLTRREKLDIHQTAWGDVRIALDPSCLVARSLGLTLECAFADIARQIEISAVGCEFEMRV